MHSRQEVTGTSDIWAADEAFLVGTRDAPVGLQTRGGAQRNRDLNARSTASNPFSPISVTGASFPSLHSIPVCQSPPAAHGSNVETPRPAGQQQQEQMQKQQKDPLRAVLSEQYMMECLTSIAYLVGSPLQRCQPTAEEPVQRSMGMVRELLLRGVNPEHIVRVIESREGIGV